jgi:hypothetical protein
VFSLFACLLVVCCNIVRELQQHKTVVRGEGFCFLLLVAPLIAFVASTSCCAQFERFCLDFSIFFFFFSFFFFFFLKKLLLLFAFVSVVVGKCHGTANSLPFVTQSPVLVNSVTNAKMFVVNAVSPPLLIAHIWGDAGRERGRAYGAILKPYARTVHDTFLQWAEENVESAIVPYVPKDIAVSVTMSLLFWGPSE